MALGAVLWCVNQMLPSPPAVMAPGWLAVGIRNSVMVMAGPGMPGLLPASGRLVSGAEASLAVAPPLPEPPVPDRPPMPGPPPTPPGGGTPPAQLHPAPDHMHSRPPAPPAAVPA